MLVTTAVTAVTSVTPVTAVTAVTAVTTVTAQMHADLPRAHAAMHVARAADKRVPGACGRGGTRKGTFRGAAAGRGL